MWFLSSETYNANFEFSDILCYLYGMLGSWWNAEIERCWNKGNYSQRVVRKIKNVMNCFLALKRATFNACICLTLSFSGIILDWVVSAKSISLSLFFFFLQWFSCNKKLVFLSSLLHFFYATSLYSWTPPSQIQMKYHDLRLQSNFFKSPVTHLKEGITLFYAAYDFFLPNKTVQQFEFISRM